MTEEIPRKSAQIYFFSGTGNARAAANWFTSTARENGWDTTLTDLSALKKRRLKHPPEKDLIGFFCPTHGFNLPPIMLHFIFRYPRKRGQRVILLNTRAGMKMGKLFLPGLSGMALWLPALVMLLKGYRIGSLKSIDLPSNWISLHPGIKPRVVDSMYQRRKRQTEDFARKILAGRSEFRPLRSLVLDIAVTPIGFLYYFFGRFVLGKTFIATRDCTRCDICVKQCPVKAIKIVDGRCFWTHNCESCMHCINVCPHRAIETAHGFIIGFSILIYYGLFLWLLELTGLEEFLGMYLSGRLLDWTVWIIKFLVYFGLLLLFYRIMHYLLRIRIFERVLVYSSLTHFKFWRRYKPSRSAKK